MAPISCQPTCKLQMQVLERPATKGGWGAQLLLQKKEEKSMHGPNSANIADTFMALPKEEIFENKHYASTDEAREWLDSSKENAKEWQTERIALGGMRQLIYERLLSYMRKFIKKEGAHTQHQ